MLEDTWNLEQNIQKLTKWAYPPICMKLWIVLILFRPLSSHIDIFHHECLSSLFLSLFILVYFWERVSACGFGWPETCSNRPAFVFSVNPRHSRLLWLWPASFLYILWLPKINIFRVQPAFSYRLNNKRFHITCSLCNMYHAYSCFWRCMEG